MVIHYPPLIVHCAHDLDVHGLSIRGRRGDCHTEGVVAYGCKASAALPRRSLTDDVPASLLASKTEIPMLCRLNVVFSPKPRR